MRLCSFNGLVCVCQESIFLRITSGQKTTRNPKTHTHKEKQKTKEILRMLTADWLCYVFFLAKIQNMHTTHKQTNNQTNGYPYPSQKLNGKKCFFFSKKLFVFRFFSLGKPKRKFFLSSCFTLSHFIIHQKEKKRFAYLKEKNWEVFLFSSRKKIHSNFLYWIKDFIRKNFCFVSILCSNIMQNH